ncbi:Uncharacterised protein [Bordetella pertussis]|nr:Uncharacterised protein [Bordetella pertussis]
MNTEMAARPSDSTNWLTVAGPMERATCRTAENPLGAVMRQPCAARSTGFMTGSSTRQSRVLQREVSMAGSTSPPRRIEVNDTCSTTRRAASSVCAFSSRLVATSAHRR